MVKWTPDIDQLLLLKILETHDLSVDTKKIVQAWPADKEKPTPRAITERLAKIRKEIKNGVSTPTKAGTGSRISKSGATTPKTPRTPKTPKSATATPRSKQIDSFINDNSVEEESLVKNESEDKKSVVKPENENDDMMEEFVKLDDDDMFVVNEAVDTPTKRVRKTRTQHPDFVSYKDESDGHETSASEFLPGEEDNDVLFESIG